jgi:hypothetical protein
MSNSSIVACAFSAVGTCLQSRSLGTPFSSGSAIIMEAHTDRERKQGDLTSLLFPRNKESILKRDNKVLSVNINTFRSSLQRNQDYVPFSHLLVDGLFAADSDVLSQV